MSIFKEAKIVFVETGSEHSLRIRTPFVLPRTGHYPLAAPPRHVPTEEPPAAPVEVPPDAPELPEPSSPEIPWLSPDEAPDTTPSEMAPTPSDVAVSAAARRDCWATRATTLRQRLLP